jgi:hypothetical protein
MRLPIFLLLSALMLTTEVAAAAPPVTSNLRDLLRVARPTVVVPPEWSGVWMNVTNLYQCGGGLIFTGSERDTLCTGQDISEQPPGVEVMETCTGFADATTVDVTCSGSGEFFPGCLISYVSEIDGTITGESYSIVVVTNSTFSGTVVGCGPDNCVRIEITGTRLEPEPAAYCATPTLPSTWGRVKAQYR